MDFNNYYNQTDSYSNEINSYSNDCYLNTYLGPVHATVELNCLTAVKTMVVGLSMNPSIVSLALGIIGSVATTYASKMQLKGFLSQYTMLFSPIKGNIGDEDLLDVMIHHPSKVEMLLTPAQAEKVRDFILTSRHHYEHGTGYYSLMGNNCIDFADNVNQLAGRKEHFVEEMEPSFRMGWAYAKISSLLQKIQKTNLRF